MNLGTIAYCLVAVAYAMVTGAAVRYRKISPTIVALGIAALITALWGVVLCLSALRGDVPIWEAALLNALRYASWFAALTTFAEVQVPRGTRNAAYGCCAASLVAVLGHEQYTSIAGLTLSLMGLLFIEQLIRNATPARRRIASFAVVGIGGQFAYDLFLNSQAQLLGSVSGSTWAARGFVLALLAPAVVLTIRRFDTAKPMLFVSRHVVFYTSTLVAVGAYLCVMSLGGYYVRLHGGTWGSLLQILFLCGAAIVLASLLLIESPWRRLRVFIATHFYRNKYDYRVEWLRFVQTLSASQDGDPYRSAIRAVSQIFRSDGGWLLLRSESQAFYDAVASWPEDLGSLDQRVRIGTDSDLCQFIDRKQWVVHLREYRREPDLYGNIALPDWLPTDGPLQILIPLLVGNDLIGLLLLRAPAEPFDMSFEDRDLLKTVGRHVALQVAQRRADERLAEERQFSAYHRFAAFVMHDLKNSVAQLQLLVNNATRHRHNPAFLDDAISTISNTVHRMTRLIEQLQSRELQGTSRTVDLAGVVSAAAARSLSRAPAAVLQGDIPLTPIKADPDTLGAVLDHLIRNAQEASVADGSIQLQLTHLDGEAELIIADDGSGMDPEFVRERLFRPFDTTKGTKGMGIGAYQAREYVRSLGGEIEVQSNPGRGTRFYIRLKLCPA